MKKMMLTLLALALILGISACAPQKDPNPNEQPQQQTISKGEFDELSNQTLAASEVVVSPDSKRDAIVYPLEFEEKTEVYVYDHEKKQGLKVISEQDLDPQKNIKNIAFYDNDNLLLVIGARYGTTSVGGDVYNFNIETKQLKPLYKNAVSTEQVLKAEPAEGGLTLTVAVFDEEMLEYTAQVRFVATADLIKE